MAERKRLSLKKGNVFEKEMKNYLVLSRLYGKSARVHIERSQAFFDKLSGAPEKSLTRRSA